MRLIDADELKKDLSRFYDGEVTAKQLIDEQPTIGGWISVKDRLPEKNGDYLAYTRDGIVWPYYFTATSGVWEDSLGYSTDTVTHWMLLPEPPKEDVNGNMDF